mmetsp:Transcript_6766/g.10350  ORF Transcript_6766/g.10350 Transcript_6766/m.10350 type:complete len:110 (-) Transcript_6766:490-819(-)
MLQQNERDHEVTRARRGRRKRNRQSFEVECHIDSNNPHLESKWFQKLPIEGKRPTIFPKMFFNTFSSPRAKVNVFMKPRFTDSLLSPTGVVRPQAIRAVPQGDSACQQH